MSDRIISERWALICPNGEVAGDGESTLDWFSTREQAEAELLPKETDDLGCKWLDFLKSMNNCETFRVGLIRTVEVDAALAAGSEVKK